MSRTRVDLVTEALDNLGVTIVGQDPSAEDTAKVDGKVDGLLADLRVRGILYVGDADAIEDEHFDSLGILLANRCAAAFGGGRDRDVDRAEEQKLRLLNPRPGGYDILATDYF